MTKFDTISFAPRSHLEILKRLTNLLIIYNAKTMLSKNLLAQHRAFFIVFGKSGSRSYILRWKIQLFKASSHPLVQTQSVD